MRRPGARGALPGQNEMPSEEAPLTDANYTSPPDIEASLTLGSGAP